MNVMRNDLAKSSIFVGVFDTVTWERPSPSNNEYNTIHSELWFAIMSVAHFLANLLSSLIHGKLLCVLVPGDADRKSVV